MNRRSLFKSLLGVAVAVSIDLGMSVPDVPSVAKKSIKVVLNPEYVTADYEDFIFFAEGDPKQSEIRRFKRSRIAASPPIPQDLPPRYNYVNGEWIKVSPYMTIES